MSKVSIRRAKENDTPLILNFIKQLSIYEKLPNEVTADVQTLHKSLFVEQNAKVVFIMDGE